MQLSKTLPQFTDAPTLLLVVGWQHGKIFHALNGFVEQVGEILIPKHVYSDNEGHFETRTKGAGGTIRSGVAQEPKKEHIRKEFLRRFMETVGEFVAEHKVAKIYLFSPPRGLQGLESSLPSEIRGLTQSFYSGNYTHTAPDDLVGIIQKEKPKPVDLMSEEAKKILDRGAR